MIWRAGIGHMVVEDRLLWSYRKEEKNQKMEETMELQNGVPPIMASFSLPSHINNTNIVL